MKLNIDRLLQQYNKDIYCLKLTISVDSQLYWKTVWLVDLKKVLKNSKNDKTFTELYILT